MKFSNLFPTHYNATYLESKAYRVLETFDFQTPDQIDINVICSHYGIKIKTSAEPDLTFSVCTGLRKGVIYIQPGLDYIEYKELAGEEFAHLYLHAISQLHSTPGIVAKQERQAKVFSACLYMPYKMLREVALSYDQPVDISTLADEFLVSEAFVYYRLSLLFPEKADAIARSKGSFGYLKWLE